MRYLLGNWKMSINLPEIEAFLGELKKTKLQKNLIFGIASPNVFFDDLKKMFKLKGWQLGAQNVSYAQNGAFTGEVSALMLKDKQIDFCLVGHSERRTLFFEDDKAINQKIKQLLDANITPVLCIGETLEQYTKKETKRILQKQLKIGLKDISSIEKIVVAYEPVWAIGTGKSASTQDIKSSVEYIKSVLKKLYPQAKTLPAVLYGGSVKPENAKQIFELECVDGALVGGASLKLEKFLGIAQNM